MKYATKWITKASGLLIMVGAMLGGTSLKAQAPDPITVDNVGQYHNEIVGAYLAAKQPLITSTNYAKQTPALIAWLCNSMMQNGIVNLCKDQRQDANRYIQAYEQGFGSYPRTQYINSLIDGITAKFPLKGDEYSLVSQLKGVLQKGGTPKSMAASFSALDRLFKSNSHDFVFAEWFGGAISIGKSSAEFWGGVGGTYVDPTQVEGFLVGDAAGYILGWSYEVFDEWHSGTLTRDREWYRIGKGLQGAGWGSLLPAP
ncbi:MAG: hypothetical protein JSS84_10130 [Bacteroidetes bacterium]|nr:hypothetical protein [Bacteroidota bacterium]